MRRRWRFWLRWRRLRPAQVAAALQRGTVLPELFQLGTRPVGTSPEGGSAKPDAYMFTRRATGMSDGTLTVAAGCSSYTPHGEVSAGTATLRMRLPANSYFELGVSGVVTAAVGESGQRPGCVG